MAVHTFDTLGVSFAIRYYRILYITITCIHFDRFLPMSDDEDDVKRTVRSLKDKR